MIKCRLEVKVRLCVGVFFSLWAVFFFVCLSVCFLEAMQVTVHTDLTNTGLAQSLTSKNSLVTVTHS